MDKEIIVVYKSHYGTTKQYAKWIAQALRCQLVDASELNRINLSEFRTVIYGGALYASGIAGIKALKRHQIRHLVLFTVGLADPELTDYTKIMNANGKNLNAQRVSEVHLRGGIDYAKLSLVHRMAMAAMKKISIYKHSQSKLTGEQKAFVETYGGQVGFVDKKSIQPILDLVALNH